MADPVFFMRNERMIKRFVLWLEHLEEIEMKRIRNCLSLIILILLTFSSVLAGYAEEETDIKNDQIPVKVSFDLTRWDCYWKRGEKRMEDTEESRIQVNAILEKVNQASEGMLVREGADADTVELQYELYQRMLQDGAEIEPQLFDDIGTYTWAVGLPDEQSITQDQAWRIACRVLLEEAGVSEEQLTHFYPHFSYETGDPENPFWHLILMPYDAGSEVSVVYEVAVYAHDGSVCGYKIGAPVG